MPRGESVSAETSGSILRGGTSGSVPAETGCLTDSTSSSTLPVAAAHHEVQPRLAWISPKKTSTVLLDSPLQVNRRYPLHRVLTDRKLSYDEFRSFDLVAIEVPPIAADKYELGLLRLVTGILAVGTHVLVVVQPSLRKHSVRCLWIQKWNFMQQVPFRFHQICSSHFQSKVCPQYLDTSS